MMSTPVGFPTQSPFPFAPSVDHFFSSQAAETARERLHRVIQREEGPALLLGRAGTGKTLLLNLLAQELAGAARIIRLPSGRLESPRLLFQAICYVLELPFRDAEEGDLRLSLVEFLESPQNSQGVVLLVDEAHALPAKLIEELRMLTNIVQDGRSRMRLILAGNPQIEERLAHPRLESFNQRIVARCPLGAWSRAELQQYIGYQLERAGLDRELFTAAAVEQVHEFSGGIPRVVNQVCDQAWLISLADGLPRLEKVHIEQAWCDLTQLPPPSSPQGSDNANNAEAIIEFGALDETDEPATCNEGDDEGPQTLRAFDPEETLAEEPLWQPVDIASSDKTDAPKEDTVDFFDDLEISSLDLGVGERTDSLTFKPSATDPVDQIGAIQEQLAGLHGGEERFADVLGGDRTPDALVDHFEDAAVETQEELVVDDPPFVEELPTEPEPEPEYAADATALFGEGFDEEFLPETLDSAHLPRGGEGGKKELSGARAVKTSDLGSLAGPPTESAGAPLKSVPLVVQDRNCEDASADPVWPPEEADRGEPAGATASPATDDNAMFFNIHQHERD